MDDKKDIGELFEKNLSDAAMLPKDKVWSAIEKTLLRKRRTRLGYIWLSSLIGLLIVIFLFSLSQANDSELSPSKNSTDSIVPKINSNDLLEKSTIRQTKKQNEITNENEKSGLPKSVKVISQKTSKDSKNVDEQPTQTVSRLNSNPANKVTKRTRSVKNLNREEEVAVSNNESLKKATLSFEETATVAKGGETTNIDRVNNKNIDKIVKNGSQQEIGEKPTSKKYEKPDLLITELLDSVKLETDTIQENLKTNKKPIDRKIKKDSLKQPIKNGEIKKYRLFSFADVSHYSSLKKLSDLDPQLNENNKSSTLRAGYGAYLIFKASPKLRLRLGAAHTAIQKNTFDVAIAPGDLAFNYYKDISFQDKINFISFSNSFSQPTNITLEQRLAYFKIMVEMSYTVWEKSEWGVDAIAGISVSRLGKNRLSAILNDGTVQFLGSNNNYSKGHFGLQLGSGLYYNPNQTIQLRFESFIEPRFGVFENKGANTPIIINARLGIGIKL